MSSADFEVHGGASTLAGLELNIPGLAAVRISHFDLIKTLGYRSFQLFRLSIHVFAGLCSIHLTFPHPPHSSQAHTVDKSATVLFRSHRRAD